MSQMTESDVRDGVVYVRAYLQDGRDALAVLARYGDTEAMLTAMTAIFSGHLVNVFNGSETSAIGWLDGIITETAAT